MSREYEATLVRDLALEFTKHRYPEEVMLFEIVWARYQESQQSGADTPVHGPEGCGLPLAEEDAADLALPTIIASIASAVSQLSHAQAITLEEVKKVLAMCAERVHSKRVVAEQLLNAVAPMIAELHVSNESSGREPGDRPSQPDASLDRGVFVTRRIDGRNFKSGGPRRLNVVADARKNDFYDIVIDEINLELLWQPERMAGSGYSDPRHFAEVDKRAMALLWLALMNYGGSVSFDKIRQMCGLEDCDLVYKVKTTLMHVLGASLRDRIVGTTSNNSYRILKEFNFCWLRDSKERGDSRMLEYCP